MGDKPSVEAKTEADENDLCHFESVTPVLANAVADSSLADNSALNSSSDTPPSLPYNEHSVNSVVGENSGCYNSPSSPARRFVASGRSRCAMKQSRSVLGHNMNGDGTVWYRDVVPHSASVDAMLTSVDDVPASRAVADLNCEVMSCHDDTVADNSTSAPTVAASNSAEPLSSPSSSSSVTVVSVVHADNEGRCQRSG